MSGELIIKGPAFVVKDRNGKFIDDIDTDQIFHNKHLAITDIKEMGKYAFGNLEGYEDFPTRAKPGTILVVGKNFGSGSSRAQAVDCFRALGVSLIIGQSFGAIYWRNGVNAGLPLLRIPELLPDMVETDDELEIDLTNNKAKNLTKKIDLPVPLPFSQVQREIYLAGGLFNFGRKLASKGIQTV